MIQTTSLRTSQILRDAGFPQESYFSHETTNTTFDGEKYIKLVGKEYKRFSGAYYYVSAPTSDEIIEKLPYMIKQDGNHTVLVIGKPNNIFKVGYRPWQRVVMEFENKSLPEALAQMYLYLNQQGLLEKKNE